MKGHPKYPYFYDATGYGTGDGLGGWNCRHSFFPYFEGLSVAANAPDFSKEENAQVYADTQKQRAYERSIRKSKRELAALDGARSETGDPVLKAKLDREFERKSVTLKNREARLNEHLKATGLLPDSSRVRVDGFGKSVSQKAVWANKRYTTLKKSASIHERETYNNAFKANREYLESTDYLRKFKGITSNAIGDRLAAEYAKKAVLSNDGMTTETAYILSSVTGRLKNNPIQLNEFGGSFQIPYGKANSFILIHNHPNSAAFSFDDFVTLNDFPEIKTMVAVGHNGTVYVMSVGKGKRLDLTNKFEYELMRNEWNRCYRDLNGDIGAVTDFCERYGWTFYVK